MSFMMQHGFLRHGVMVAFESFEEFSANHHEVINLFRDDEDDSDDEKSFAEVDGSFNFRNLVGTPSSFEEPTSAHMVSSPTRTFGDPGRNFGDLVTSSNIFVSVLVTSAD